MKVTERERAAVDAISRYPSVEAAAFALGKSPWTVKEQLASARRRLGVETNAQAVGEVLRRADG